MQNRERVNQNVVASQVSLKTIDHHVLNLATAVPFGMKQNQRVYTQFEAQTSFRLKKKQLFINFLKKSLK